jgi:hypothetical protein
MHRKPLLDAVVNILLALVQAWNLYIDDFRASVKL